MSKPIENISVETVLEKIDQSKREEFKKKFQELEALRIQDPEHMIKYAEHVKKQHEKNIDIYKQRIAELDGTTKEDENNKIVHTGLLLLQDKLKKSKVNNNENEIKKWEQAITENRSERQKHEDILKKVLEGKGVGTLDEAKQNLLAAQKLAEEFSTKKQLMQKALQEQGLTGLIYNVDNINCKSLRQTISMSVPESNVDKENKPPIVYAQTGPKYADVKKQNEGKKSQNNGYLSSPDELEKNIKALGISNVLKSDTRWSLQDTKGKVYSIDNDTVTCAADKNDKATLETMVMLFKKCEFNKFIANGGKPEEFDPSKIKPKVTGEAAEEILKICAEKGIGTAYSSQKKPVSPTNISGDDTSKSNTPPIKDDEPPQKPPRPK